MAMESSPMKRQEGISTRKLCEELDSVIKKIKATAVEINTLRGCEINDGSDGICSGAQAICCDAFQIAARVDAAVLAVDQSTFHHPQLQEEFLKCTEAKEKLVRLLSEYQPTPSSPPSPPPPPPPSSTSSPTAEQARSEVCKEEMGRGKQEEGVEVRDQEVGVVEEGQKGMQEVEDSTKDTNIMENIGKGTNQAYEVREEWKQTQEMGGEWGQAQGIGSEWKQSVEDGNPLQKMGKQKRTQEMEKVNQTHGLGKDIESQGVGEMQTQRMEEGPHTQETEEENFEQGILENMKQTQQTGVEMQVDEIQDLEEGKGENKEPKGGEGNQETLKMDATDHPQDTASPREDLPHGVETSCNENHDSESGSGLMYSAECQ